VADGDNPPPHTFFPLQAGKVKLNVREDQIIQEGTRMLTIE
jgi:hypothetical protein